MAREDVLFAPRDRQPEPKGATTAERKAIPRVYNDPLSVSIGWAADHLGYHQETIRAMVRRGELEALPRESSCHQYRIAVRELLRWTQKYPQKAPRRLERELLRLLPVGQALNKDLYDYIMTPDLERTPHHA